MGRLLSSHASAAALFPVGLILGGSLYWNASRVRMMFPDLYKTINFLLEWCCLPPPPHSYRQSDAITHRRFLKSGKCRWCHIVWGPPQIGCDKKNSLLLVLSFYFSSSTFKYVYSVKGKETMGLFHFNLETSLALCCCHLKRSYGQKNDAMKNKWPGECHKFLLALSRTPRSNFLCLQIQKMSVQIASAADYVKLHWKPFFQPCFGSVLCLNFHGRDQPGCYGTRTRTLMDRGLVA